jgi:hypothetical protein
MKTLSFSTEYKLEITLLACSPMASIEQEDGLPNVNEENETTKFNAETHVQFFTDMLSLYSLSINSCVVRAPFQTTAAPTKSLLN